MRGTCEVRARYEVQLTCDGCCSPILPPADPPGTSVVGSCAGSLPDLNHALSEKIVYEFRTPWHGSAASSKGRRSHSITKARKVLIIPQHH